MGTKEMRIHQSSRGTMTDDRVEEQLNYHEALEVVLRYCCTMNAHISTMNRIMRSYGIKVKESK
jgi:hypothetical protein